jgi:hypothetical protein
MSDQEERESILKWLFDACFGRIGATVEQIGAAIHRLGTLNRRLKED